MKQLDNHQIRRMIIAPENTAKLISYTLTRYKVRQKYSIVHFLGRGFLSSKRPDRLWGPPRFLLSSYQVSSLGLKWRGHEANHSHPSGAKVKNVWLWTSTPPVCFHGVHNDDIAYSCFAFTFLVRKRFALRISCPSFLIYCIFCITLTISS